MKINIQILKSPIVGILPGFYTADYEYIDRNNCTVVNLSGNLLIIDNVNIIETNKKGVTNNNMFGNKAVKATFELTLDPSKPLFDIIVLQSPEGKQVLQDIKSTFDLNYVSVNTNGEIKATLATDFQTVVDVNSTYVINAYKELEKRTAEHKYTEAQIQADLLWAFAAKYGFVKKFVLEVK